MSEYFLDQCYGDFMRLMGFKLNWICFFLLTLCLYWGCGSNGGSARQGNHNDGQPESTTLTLKEFNASEITFQDDDVTPGDLDETLYNTCAMAFFDSVKNASEADNAVVSPLSYFGMIRMVSQGAAGETADFFSETYPFLGSLTIPEGLVLTHRFWGQSGYRFFRDYLALMKEMFEPVFCEVNFLNDVLEADTRIKADLKDMDQLMDMSGTTTAETVALTRVVMGNHSQMAGISGFFQGVDTVEGVFETREGKLYQCNHVRVQGQYGVFESDEMTVIQGADPDSGLSVILVFPDSGTLNPGTEALSVPLETRDISFSIPEFSIHTKYDASPDLNLEDDSSDFSRVNGLGYLFVRSVLTEARIVFDENGIDVSAMSSAVIEATEDEPFSLLIDDVIEGGGGGTGFIITTPPPEYCINPDSHPFLFYIMDTQTQTVLHAGFVRRPNGKFIGYRSSEDVCGSSLGLEYLFGKSMTFVADRMADYSDSQNPVTETTEEDYGILGESLEYALNFSSSVTPRVAIDPGLSTGAVVDYGPDYIIYERYSLSDTVSNWVFTVRLENEVLYGELSFYGDGNGLERSQRGVLLPIESVE